MEASLNLGGAHFISDKVAEAMLFDFPNAEVIPHADPAGDEDERQGF